MTIVYIGLGSNLDNPVTQINTALDELGRIPNTKLLVKSSLYKSSPSGPQDQPDFINAVAKLDTILSAIKLLETLQDIEHQHGRQRTRHWGPRTLDLDILLYGKQKMCTERLTIPHPEIGVRHFVLYPLMEIDDDIEIPDLGNVSELIVKLGVKAPDII
jgi:2-amino-4-hydroxy-6-hydroxymethyldihydropteridine diphosphokinase